MAFRTGAFLAAAQAGIPVVPVALRGVRSVLRDGTWLPRAACRSSSAAARAGGHRLGRGREAARAPRAQILRCGEPDLVERHPSS